MKRWEVVGLKGRFWTKRGANRYGHKTMHKYEVRKIERYRGRHRRKTFWDYWATPTLTIGLGLLIACLVIYGYYWATS